MEIKCPNPHPIVTNHWSLNMNRCFKVLILYLLLMPLLTMAQNAAYEEEEIVVNYRQKGNDVTLTGTLTIPKTTAAGQKRFPAVVLVSGSGQQDRDETLMGHKPFRAIAEYFAQRGIATLRYDDRGVGGSKGDLETATTYDFADDAEAMFMELRKHSKIDPKRVGIVGHSEGGAIAPMIAARNKKVSFVVMLAGQGCSGGEVLLQQNRALFQLKGVEDSLIDVRLRCMEAYFDAMNRIAPEQYDSVFKSIANMYAGHLTKKQRRTVGVLGGDAYLFAQQFRTIPWWRTFVMMDPADYLPKVKCPILALNGDKDCQVIAEPNLEAIRRLARRAKLTTCLIPDKNHLFQTCTTGAVEEYATLPEDIAPDVLELMSQWILELGK